MPRLRLLVLLVPLPLLLLAAGCLSGTSETTASSVDQVIALFAAAENPCRDVRRAADDNASCITAREQDIGIVVSKSKADADRYRRQAAADLAGTGRLFLVTGGLITIFVDDEETADWVVKALPGRKVSVNDD